MDQHTISADNPTVDAEEIAPFPDTPAARVMEIFDRLGPVVSALVIAALSGIILSFFILFVRAAGAFAWVTLALAAAAAGGWFAYKHQRKLVEKDDAAVQTMFADVSERFAKLESMTKRLADANRRLDDAVVNRFRPLSPRGSAMFHSSRRLQSLLEERLKRLRPFIGEVKEPTRLASANTILDLPIAFSPNLPSGGSMPSLSSDKWEEMVEIFVREMDAELELSRRTAAN